MISVDPMVNIPVFKFQAVPDLTCKPRIVQPYPRKWSMEELEKTIPASYGPRIPEMHHKWWKDFHVQTKHHMEVSLQSICTAHVVFVGYAFF